MLDFKGWHVIPKTPAKRKSLKSVTLCAYYAADVMGNDSFATVLESYVTISSLHVAQVNTKKVPALEHLILAKK